MGCLQGPYSNLSPLGVPSSQGPMWPLLCLSPQPPSAYLAALQRRPRGSSTARQPQAPEEVAEAAQRGDAAPQGPTPVRGKVGTEAGARLSAGTSNALAWDWVRDRDGDVLWRNAKRAMASGPWGLVSGKQTAQKTRGACGCPPPPRAPAPGREAAHRHWPRRACC